MDRRRRRAIGAAGRSRAAAICHLEIRRGGSGRDRSYLRGSPLRALVREGSAVAGSQSRLRAAGKTAYAFHRHPHAVSRWRADRLQRHERGQQVHAVDPLAELARLTAASGDRRRHPSVLVARWTPDRVSGGRQTEARGSRRGCAADHRRDHQQFRRRHMEQQRHDPVWKQWRPCPQCRRRGASAGSSARSGRANYAQYWPQFLPDGEHFLYAFQSSSPNGNGFYIGSLDGKLRP